MIPAAAVEAAAEVMLSKMYADPTLRVDDEDRDIMRAALEAAAPHMLAGAEKGSGLSEVWVEGRLVGWSELAENSSPWRKRSDPTL